MIIEVTVAGTPILLNRNSITAIKEGSERRAIISANIDGQTATFFHVDQTYNEVKKYLGSDVVTLKTKLSLIQ